MYLICKMSLIMQFYFLLIQFLNNNCFYEIVDIKAYCHLGVFWGFLLCWLCYYPHGDIIMGLVVKASCSFPHLSGFLFLKKIILKSPKILEPENCCCLWLTEKKKMVFFSDKFNYFFWCFNFSIFVVI